MEPKKDKKTITLQFSCNSESEMKVYRFLKSKNRTTSRYICDLVGREIENQDVPDSSLSYMDKQEIERMIRRVFRNEMRDEIHKSVNKAISKLDSNDKIPEPIQEEKTSVTQNQSPVDSIEPQFKQNIMSALASFGL